MHKRSETAVQGGKWIVYGSEIDVIGSGAW